MDQWAAIITTVATALGLGATVLATDRRTRRELGDRIDRVGTVLRARIDGVETGLGARIDRPEGRIDRVESSLGERIDRLDDRVYALAAGLAPRLEPTTRDD